MPHAQADGIQIFYDVTGAEGDPVVVLISGGGAQLISWDEQLVGLLVANGLRVVRFDNRDTGFSHRFGGELDVDGGYDLSDMANDVLLVLDDLGVHAAHLVGHSMGGMMAQMVALAHPDRVLSLGLLSTIPGQDPRYILHGDRAELSEAPLRFSREQIVEFAGEYARVASPPRYDPQVQWHRDRAGDAFDRGYAPEGFARQWSALMRAPERLDGLRAVTVPTLVFHGRDDDVLHWVAAVDIADAITGSELQVHADMGHLIPHELWPDLVAAITRTVARGEEIAAG